MTRNRTAEELARHREEEKRRYHKNKERKAKRLEKRRETQRKSSRKHYHMKKAANMSSSSNQHPHRLSSTGTPRPAKLNQARLTSSTRNDDKHVYWDKTLETETRALRSIMEGKRSCRKDRRTQFAKSAQEIAAAAASAAATSAVTELRVYYDATGEDDDKDFDHEIAVQKERIATVVRSASARKAGQKITNDFLLADYFDQEANGSPDRFDDKASTRKKDDGQKKQSAVLAPTSSTLKNDLPNSTAMASRRTTDPSFPTLSGVLADIVENRGQLNDGHPDLFYDARSADEERDDDDHSATQKENAATATDVALEDTAGQTNTDDFLFADNTENQDPNASPDLKQPAVLLPKRSIVKKDPPNSTTPALIGGADDEEHEHDGGVIVEETTNTATTGRRSFLGLLSPRSLFGGKTNDVDEKKKKSTPRKFISFSEPLEHSKSPPCWYKMDPKELKNVFSTADEDAAGFSNHSQADVWEMLNAANVHSLLDPKPRTGLTKTALSKAAEHVWGMDDDTTALPSTKRELVPFIIDKLEGAKGRVPYANPEDVVAEGNAPLPLQAADEAL